MHHLVNKLSPSTTIFFIIVDVTKFEVCYSNLPKFVYKRLAYSHRDSQPRLGKRNINRYHIHNFKFASVRDMFVCTIKRSSLSCLTFSEKNSKALDFAI